MNREAIDLMISWIQKRIKISYFDNSLWTFEHEKIIETFLTDIFSNRLFAFVDVKKHELYLAFDPPSKSDNAVDVAFFVHPPGTHIDYTNIDKIIQFGTFSTKQTPSSVMHIIEEVIYPHVFRTIDWSVGTRTELAGHYHRLMASLNDCSNNIHGKTNLYLPFKNNKFLGIEDYNGKNTNIDEIQLYEFIAIHWTKQLKTLIIDKHQTRNIEELGPLEEINFWRSRANDFSCVSRQLLSKGIQYVLSVLRQHNSAYLAPLK